jgi:glycine dehydrogenase subunit 1
LPARKSELEVQRRLAGLAAKNASAADKPFFLGCGAYRHHIPATVDHLVQRSEFLTSYTPYQPEISQGTLQCLFEFQTQAAALTGMDVANASMYDGSTACVEAISMAHRITRRRKAVLSGGLHPHYADAAQTFARMSGDEVQRPAPDFEGVEDLAALLDDDSSCLVVQTPDVFGRLRDLRALSGACKARGVLLVAVVTEVVSLGALVSPGEMGADIVVGEGQSLGSSLSFGGPYVGLFASRAKFLRQMPGRLCGQTSDVEGRRGFVLTLSTREQHIRREKATSNICTNSGLCALAFTIHMTLLGESGLRRLARANHASAAKLFDLLAGVADVRLMNRSFFNEFALRLPADAAQVAERMAERGVLAGVPFSRLQPDAGGDDILIVACTETNTDEDRAAFIDALHSVLSQEARRPPSHRSQTAAC